MAADGGANCLYETAGVHGDPCFVSPRAHPRPSQIPLPSPANLPSPSKDNLDTIIGDLDSLSLETRRYYESRPPTSTSTSPRTASSSTTQILHVPEQESTDFAKAVSHVRHDDQQYPRGGGSNPLPLDIVALGGLGGRVDQGVSQLHHLFLFQAGDATYARGRVFLFSGESLTWLLKPGLHRIRVRDAKRRDRRADNTANENDKGKNNNKNGPPPPLDSPRHPGNPPPPPPAPPRGHPRDAGPPRPAASADAAPSLSRGRPGDAAADAGADGGDDNEDNDGKDDDNGDVFGKYVGILPVGGPSTITTRGLEWDVRAWVTEFGGRVSTSNHVLPETEVVEVETTREVLFTIALRGV